MLKALQKMTTDPAYRSEIHLSAKTESTLSTRWTNINSLHMSSGPELPEGYPLEGTDFGFRAQYKSIE
jgi:hypothetical protein